MSKLSIVIITFNEEKNLPATLEAAKKVSDDIVVVDSYSTDTTKDIAEKFGARVFQQAWQGYSKQKNFGNAQAKNDYVLSLDADEVLSEELIKSIQQTIVSPQYDAYKIKRVNIFFGKEIRFGSNKSEMLVRLFNKHKIQWNDSLVHESLELKGAKAGVLDGSLKHYTAQNPDEYIQKQNQYSTLYAEQEFAKGRKASAIKLYLSPMFTFIREYIFRLGLLDGFIGYFLAKQAANYTFLKYGKLKMKK